ncbi:MAG TPA: hypothetical protein VGB19_00685 [Actinomycetota bacterium]
MTKRSALTLAGGLVTAIVAGLVALTINLGIVGAAGSPSGPGALGASKGNPIVKTITKTVTIHRRAKAAQMPGGARQAVTIVRHLSGGGSGGSGSSTGSTGHSSSGESEGSEDHEPEQEGTSQEGTANNGGTHEFGGADDD